MTIGVLIVDDHSVVRQGLRMFLALDEDLEIVGEAEDGAEALQQAQALQPDVVLMDLLMPKMDGLTAISQMRQTLPYIEIIALTSVLEDASVVGAVRAGAIGYLLKNTEADELCRAGAAFASGCGPADARGQSPRQPGASDRTGNRGATLAGQGVVQ